MTDADRWIKAHGAENVIRPDEVPELNGAVHRVYLLMRDGAWHSREEICLAAGKNGRPASEGLRRLRDLRAKLRSVGVRIDTRRIGDGRHFMYRMMAVLTEGNKLLKQNQLDWQA